MRMRNHLAYIIVLAVLLGVGLSGCKEKTVSESVPGTNLSEEIRNAPTAVQEAYRFAVANPDILKQIPCYCGCGSMGHKSNYECYVSGIDEDGQPIFESHALG